MTKLRRNLVVSVKEQDNGAGWTPYGRINRYLGDGKWEVLLSTKHILSVDAADITVHDYKGRWERCRAAYTFDLPEEEIPYYFLRMATLRQLKQMCARYNRKAWKKFRHYEYRVGGHSWGITPGMNLKQHIQKVHMTDLEIEAETEIGNKGFCEYFNTKDAKPLSYDHAKSDLVRSFVKQLIKGKVANAKSIAEKWEAAITSGAVDFLVSHVFSVTETGYQFEELIKILNEAGVDLSSQHVKQILQISEMRDYDRGEIARKYDVD